MGESQTGESKAFRLDKYDGEVICGWRPRDLAATVERLVDPGAARETLYWGRNYLYATVVESDAGELQVAVKQFRNQGLRGRWERRLKGSKARRSWRGSLALRQAGIPTPEPLLLIESRQLDGPSFFVSHRLSDFVEARHFFRALEKGHERQEYPGLEADELMEILGRSIRRLHDAGIWHRDLSIGNLLLRQKKEEPPEVYFIDLNRMRVGERLTISRRTRDLCRLRIFQPSHQERLLRFYWGDRTRGWAVKRWLYRLYVHGFLLKIRAKDTIRHPIRSLADLLSPRRPHAHIPAAPEGAGRRDRVVWDALSDQPHQHATRSQRVAVRMADWRLHGQELSAALAALPRAWRRYRELRSRLYDEPRRWEGMGIAVRPWPQDPERLVAAIEELGVRRVLLRLHPWQAEHGDEEELARELHRRGVDLAFVLAQNRDLVCDSAQWSAAVSDLAERFGQFGCHFQIGQAVNRSKWGVWNHREYLDLVVAAAEILRKDPDVMLLGPAVIDYELHRTAGLVNIAREGAYFDILASQLYVDRRGAPENRQLGFDTVDKVVQLKAIAETATRCGDCSWITEVNWPLWEGPHSPAGRQVAVDEESQANYLVRYYLLTLGSGVVERVYWWQLIARGYGLAHDDGESGLRMRPSYHAFATLCRLLEGSTFLGPLSAPEPQRLYRFHLEEGSEILVAWSASDEPLLARLPRPAQRVLGRDGQELRQAAPGELEVEIDGSPRFFWLDSR